MKQQSVYLSRAFTGLKASDINSYYKYLSDKLESIGYIPIIPITNDINNNDDYIIGNDNEKKVSHNSSRAIISRDFFLLKQSDIILVDLTDCIDNISIGAVAELSWGFVLQKHTIVINPFNRYTSPFIVAAADVQYNILKEAINYLKILTLKY